MFSPFQIILSVRENKVGLADKVVSFPLGSNAGTQSVRGREVCVLLAGERERARVRQSHFIYTIPQSDTTHSASVVCFIAFWFLINEMECLLRS
jgi:hypothetical protein